MQPQQIRAIVICLFSRGDRILVSECVDALNGNRNCRPLGGGIDFGEPSHVAMRREIHEEVGADIHNLRLLSVMENFFTYEEQQGHEIVFVYDAEFVEPSIYEKSVLQCHEHSNNQSFTASWRSLADMQAQQLRLVPPQLVTLLQQRHKAD